MAITITYEPLEYTNPAGNFHNNAETKLLAPPAPKLLQPFVQGGTFDGATHYVTCNNSFSAISRYDISFYFRTDTSTARIFIDGRDNVSNGVKFQSGSGDFIWSHNSTDISLGDLSDNIAKKVKFVWNGSTIYSYVDGLLISETLENTAISSANMVIIGARSFTTPTAFMIGVLSGLKMIADGVTIIDEPLNWTLNNATLTGSATTFWVEEHNNLLYEDSGVPVPFGYNEIQPNHLRLNRQFADTSTENEKKNILLYNEPLVDPALAKVKKFTKQ